MAITGPRWRWLAAITAAVARAGCTAVSDGLPFAVKVTGDAQAPVAGELSGDPLPASLPIPADQALPADSQQQLQEALNREVRLAGPTVRGATAAVVTPHGVWAGSSGVDGNGVPLQPTAMMNIGAVTSTITAAEVLSLAQAGGIDLDAPAATYLSHPLLHRNPTVRQLLSHRSGIPEYIDAQALSDAIIGDPTRSWTPEEALAYATGPLTDPG